MVQVVRIVVGPKGYLVAIVKEEEDKRNETLYYVCKILDEIIIEEEDNR